MLLRVIGLVTCVLLTCGGDATPQVLRVTHFAGSPGGPGSTDGPARDARFAGASGIAVSRDGTVYIADTGNNTIRKLTTDGIVSTVAGVAGEWESADGPGTAARFQSPAYLTIDGDGNLYVSSTSDGTARPVRKVTPAGQVSTLSFSGRPPRLPGAVAAARDGTLYVGDGFVILRRNPDGATLVFAGQEGWSGHRDGDRQTALLRGPTSIDVGPDGSVFFIDGYGDNPSLRKADTDGRVTTLGTYRRAGARVSVGIDGAAYVADYGLIHRVSATGEHTVLAGALSPEGYLYRDPVDGVGDQARFVWINGLAVGPANTLVVAESGILVRTVTPDGRVTTVVGSLVRTGSEDGVGTAASFSQPSDIAVAPDGVLYVTDAMNRTIRKITPAGVVLCNRKHR